MIIVKLTMEMNKDYRFNPEENTYHIDEITADGYRRYQMRENPDKYTGEFWISKIEVNENRY